MTIHALGVSVAIRTEALIVARSGVPVAFAILANKGIAWGVSEEIATIEAKSLVKVRHGRLGIARVAIGKSWTAACSACSETS